MDTFSIKESNNNDYVCLITLLYFQNTYPSSMLNLVLYLAGSNILHGVKYIQLGIKLQ